MPGLPTAMPPVGDGLVVDLGRSAVLSAEAALVADVGVEAAALRMAAAARDEHQRLLGRGVPLGPFDEIGSLRRSRERARSAAGGPGPHPSSRWSGPPGLAAAVAAGASVRVRGTVFYRPLTPADTAVPGRDEKPKATARAFIGGSPNGVVLP